jgi:hypothetical protein
MDDERKAEFSPEADLMGMSGSGVKKDAFSNYGTNASTASGAVGTLNPIYSSMATNPEGLTPIQKANALTASSESAGGGVASAVGQGGLMAARTGNVGGATAALDDASRMADVTNSKNALDVQNQSDQLATQNKRVGLAGLNGIYDESNGQANASLNTANNAQPSFLKQLALQSAGSLRVNKNI